MSFCVSVSPSNEYSELISFRIDWFDLLTARGTLKSFLQHHSSKASILRLSAFFMVQLSYPYMTIGKIALTRWTFVGKAMSLLFNMLSMYIVASFLRSSAEFQRQARRDKKTFLSEQCICLTHFKHSLYAIILQLLFHFLSYFN